MINLRRWTKKEIQFLTANYPTVPTYLIADELNRSLSSVQNRAHKMKLKKDGWVPRRPAKVRRKYDVNENALKSLDKRTAYAIGFILADGWVGKDRIGLSNNSPLVLANVRTILGCSHKLNLEHKGPFSLYTVTITNKALAKAFADLGFTSNKSLAGRLPSIPDELFPHLLRGYFDGDGTSRYTHRGGLQIRFVSGSKALLEDIARKIHELFGVPLQKIVHDKGRPNANRLCYSGKSALAIGEHMYRDAGILCFTSKKKPFDEYINRTTNKYKLTEADVIQIRQLAADGVPQARIARQFFVSPANVKKIVLGKTWKHLPLRP